MLDPRDLYADNVTYTEEHYIICLKSYIKKKKTKLSDVSMLAHKY